MIHERSGGMDHEFHTIGRWNVMNCHDGVWEAQTIIARWFDQRFAVHDGRWVRLPVA